MNLIPNARPASSSPVTVAQRNSITAPISPFLGRYAIAGATGGALTRIDLRTLYLKDLTLLGCTFQVEAVIANLIQYIENGDIRPSVAAT